MKMPPPTALAAIGIAGTALLLAVIGAPHDRPAPAPVAQSTPEPSSVSVGGFTLASQSIDLPIDDAQYPAGPHADVINRNCTSCHSASMALTQPPLTEAQWQAEVTKMREVFHAPVPAADVPAIVGYLTAMPSQQHAAGRGAAAAPPASAPDRSGGSG